MTEAVVQTNGSSDNIRRNVSFGENVIVKERGTFCKQISIESPVPQGRSVFTFDVPIPDVPPKGARIKVVCAGVCYRRRDSSIGAESIPTGPSHTSSYRGFRDAALYPGYEVAGVIDEFGTEVTNYKDFLIGDRVIVYPDELIPHGYAEFIIVPDIDDLVKIPETIPFPVGAMLPTGALWAMNAVLTAKQYVDQFQEQDPNRLYEKQLIERTLLACNGEVDIVIDFGTTVRTLGRSLQCLSKNGGVVLIGSEVSGLLIRKFTSQCETNNQIIKAIETGSREQLQQLMDLVAEGKIKPPHYELYPADQASEAMKKVLRSEVHGRALLQFSDLI